MQWSRRDLRKDLELTDRQMEVLELVARGYTNPQIAEALGITLDGAKWHVREIIAKLGVSSREEAAAHWRARQRPGVRLARTFRGLTAPLTLKWLAAGAAMVVLTGGIVLVIAALQRGGTAEPGAPPASPASTPTSAATAATPTASQTAGASTTPLVAATVTGLFENTRALPVAARELAPPGREFPQSLPPPTFDWDDQSTMVYDRQAGTLMDLGPGEPGVFSPSGEWFVWVGPDRFTGRLHALNLRSGERKDLGTGGYPATFVDDHRVLIDDSGSEGTLLNVVTSEREPVGDRLALFASFADQLQISSPSEDRPRLIRVSDLAGTRALEFEARSAWQIGTDELLVATVPQNGLSNIFTVDFRTATATYIATTPVSERGFALGGNATHLAWSPDVCADPGETWVFDRATQEFTHVPKGLLVSAASRAPDGLLGTGFTGLERLIDPETMEYVFISPAGWPRWSRDFRYVSVGQVGGHGSFCI